MSMFPTGYTGQGWNPNLAPTPQPAPTPVPQRNPASRPPSPPPVYNPMPVPSFQMPGLNQPPTPWKAPFELGDLKSLLEQAMAVTPPKQQAQAQGQSAQQQYGGTNYTPLAYNPQQSTFIPGAMRERGQLGLRMGGYF